MNFDLKVVNKNLSCWLISIALHLSLGLFLLGRLSSSPTQAAQPRDGVILQLHVIEKKPRHQISKKNTKDLGQSSAKYLKRKQPWTLSSRQKMSHSASPAVDLLKTAAATKLQGATDSSQKGVYSLAESQEKLLLVDGYVEPSYPRRAILKRQEGVFLARLHLENGVIIREQVIQSSGYPLLDQAALSAFRQWRFRKISTQFVQQVRFKLQ